MFCCITSAKLAKVTAYSVQVIVSKSSNWLYLLLTFCEMTRDCRCFSSSLSAATRRFISFLKAVFAVRKAAILPLITLNQANVVI